MDQAWIMAVAVGVCNSGVAVAGKAAERRECRPSQYALVTFMMAGVVAFFAALGTATTWGDWRLWVFGAALGVFYLAGIATGLRANRDWPPSIVWAASNMAFVLPVLLSALFLGEPLCWLDAVIVAGVMMMLTGLAQPAGKNGVTKERMLPATSARQRWTWLTLVFAANGMIMMGFKLFRVLLPGRNSAELVTVIYGSGAVLALAMQACRGRIVIPKSEVGIGLASGAGMGLATFAVLFAMRLPAAAVFPVIQGTSLVGGVLACAMVFRERLTSRKLAALAAGLGAMALTAWR